MNQENRMINTKHDTPDNLTISLRQNIIDAYKLLYQ